MMREDLKDTVAGFRGVKESIRRKGYDPSQPAVLMCYEDHCFVFGGNHRLQAVRELRAENPGKHETIPTAILLVGKCTNQNCQSMFDIYKRSATNLWKYVWGKEI